MTVATFELGQSKPNRNTLRALRETLETQGIEFIDDPAAPGVRMGRQP